MLPERLRKVEDLYHAVQQREPVERGAFLAEACRGDKELKREVELLLVQESGGNFLDRQAAELLLESGSTASYAAAKRHIPWWMAVIALSYIVTFGLVWYLIFWGPAELSWGFASRFSDAAMVIQSVDADSQAAKGGLRAGDRVLMIDTQPVRTLRDWVEATGRMQPWHPQKWLVSRGDDRVTLEIVPVRITLKSRLAEGYVQYLSNQLIALLLGLLIAWKRPADPVGRIGAWFISTATFAFGFPPGWAVPWRALPIVLQLLLWITQLSRFVLEAIFLSFFLLFPRRLVKHRWVWFAIWAPVLATLPWRVKRFYGVIHPGQISPGPEWILTAGFVRTMVYLLIGVVVLAVSYRQVLDLNEKRRVRVLVLGTGVSLIGAAMLVWFDTFAGRMTAINVVLYVVTPLVMCGPLSLGYAILRHRLLDISLIIRQGLQYALARRAVIGLVPALGALFIFDLGLNRQQPLADILRSRGWIYPALAGLSVVAYWKRGEWLESIDRRFFRERYNAQKLLREVVGEIGTARDFQSAAVRVVQRIETALHPQFAALMLRSAGEPEYRTAAAFPSSHLLAPLPAGSMLVALLHVLGKPLEVLQGDSDWLDQRLPHEEREFVRRSRIDLLVPIATGSGSAEALLALGVKRSEEPYTREDQELLETIAASLALLPEQATHEAQPPSAGLEECPQCGVCYDSTTATCRADSVKLVPMSIPRTLAGRYRLERRRGKGGMGTVYEATDSALERRVAVKLIRDDWVDSIEAAHRFRREARAAAGFAHPNVVTIYDYGVEAETRAFLVMELLQGGTLRDELNKHKRLAPSRLVEIFRGVCAAVEAAHQRQLIHRDLKPENIFVAKGADGKEIPKVLDFGIAKFLPAKASSAVTRGTTDTHTGVLVGTPAYMAPEELLGGDLDMLWDLWALAVVAYEALTGALPFAETAVGDRRRAIMSGSFTSLSEHFDNPPEHWQSFFARSLAVDRSQRAQSASEFFSRFEQAMG